MLSCFVILITTYYSRRSLNVHKILQGAYSSDKGIPDWRAVRKGTRRDNSEEHSIEQSDWQMVITAQTELYAGGKTGRLAYINWQAAPSESDVTE